MVKRKHMKKGGNFEQDWPLARKTVSNIRTMFKQLKIPYATEMPTDKLIDFMHLCGITSSEFEEHVLLKKASHRGERIHVIDLIKAIEATTNDVKCKLSCYFRLN